MRKPTLLLLTILAGCGAPDLAVEDTQAADTIRPILRNCDTVAADATVNVVHNQEVSAVSQTATYGSLFCPDQLVLEARGFDGFGFYTFADLPSWLAPSTAGGSYPEAFAAVECGLIEITARVDRQVVTPNGFSWVIGNPVTGSGRWSYATHTCDTRVYPWTAPDSRLLNAVRVIARASTIPRKAYELGSRTRHPIALRAGVGLQGPLH